MHQQFTPRLRPKYYWPEVWVTPVMRVGPCILGMLRVCAEIDIVMVHFISDSNPGTYRRSITVVRQDGSSGRIVTI